MFLPHLAGVKAGSSKLERRDATVSVVSMGMAHAVTGSNKQAIQQLKI